MVQYGCDGMLSAVEILGTWEFTQHWHGVSWPSAWPQHQVTQHLTDARFELVSSAEEADIVWTKHYLKDFKSVIIWTCLGTSYKICCTQPIYQVRMWVMPRHTYRNRKIDIAQAKAAAEQCFLVLNNLLLARRVVTKKFKVVLVCLFCCWISWYRDDICLQCLDAVGWATGRASSQ